MSSGLKETMCSPYLLDFLPVLILFILICHVGLTVNNQSAQKEMYAVKGCEWRL